MSWAPAFSPDGASLAVGCMVTINLNDLYVWPIAGGTARRVARVQGDFTGMTWTADGGSLIYAAEGDLWRVAAGVSGGQPEKLLADVTMPALSRDGKRLAFAKRGPHNVNLWQVGLTAPARPRRSTRETTGVQPDAWICGVLARWQPGDVHIRPLGVVGDLDQ